MGDQWLKDYEKAKKSAQQLAMQLESQDAAKRPDARQAALLRGQMAQVRQEVSHLEKSLMAMSQNTQAYGVTRKELSRRGDLLATLSDQVEQLQEAVKTGARRRLEASSSSSAADPPPWRSERNGCRNDDGDDSGGCLNTEHEMLRQDESLDFLHGTVHNLKGMGQNISTEIDLHCRLLGDLEDGTDASLAKVRQNRQKLDQLSEQNTTCCLWMCICVLIFILFVLLVFV